MEHFTDKKTAIQKLVSKIDSLTLESVRGSSLWLSL